MEHDLKKSAVAYSPDKPVMSPQKAFGCEQDHLGIITEFAFAAFFNVTRNAGCAELGTDLGNGHKFNRGAKGISDGAAEKTTGVLGRLDDWTISHWLFV